MILGFSVFVSTGFKVSYKMLTTVSTECTGNHLSPASSYP